MATDTDAWIGLGVWAGLVLVAGLCIALYCLIRYFRRQRGTMYAKVRHTLDDEERQFQRCAPRSFARRFGARCLTHDGAARWRRQRTTLMSCFSLTAMMPMWSLTRPSWSRCLARAALRALCAACPRAHCVHTHTSLWPPHSRCASACMCAAGSVEDAGGVQRKLERRRWRRRRDGALANTQPVAQRC